MLYLLAWRKSEFWQFEDKHQKINSLGIFLFLFFLISPVANRLLQ